MKKLRGVNSSASARMKLTVWHMDMNRTVLSWKMPEIHRRQCEECRQHQGVFCNLIYLSQRKI
jgi:hypothetical protein